MDTVRGGKFRSGEHEQDAQKLSGSEPGLKTGYIREAGFCISASAERDGLSLVAVVMAAPTKENRTADATALLNYGFANFTAYTPAADDLAPIPVTLGTAETVQPVLEGSDSFVIEKTRAGDMQTVFDLPETLAAPVQAGQRLGRNDGIRRRRDGFDRSHHRRSRCGRARTA